MTKLDSSALSYCYKYLMPVKRFKVNHTPFKVPSPIITDLGCHLKCKMINSLR